MSFDSLRQFLIYTLSLDANFIFCLIPETQCGSCLSVGTLSRLILGESPNFSPITSKSTFAKNNIFINSTWQPIRFHYGFQATGTHFIDTKTCTSVLGPH